MIRLQEDKWWPLKGPFVFRGQVRRAPAAGVSALLGAGVLGDGLGAFADGVLGELTRQEEPDGSLHLSAGDRGALVVVSQTRSFSGDALEDVVDKAVHDAHGLAGDARIGMHLLQHFVDVNGIALLPPALLLLVGFGDVLLCLSGFLGGFSTGLGRHDARYRFSALSNDDDDDRKLKSGEQLRLPFIVARGIRERDRKAMWDRNDRAAMAMFSST